MVEIKLKLSSEEASMLLGFLSPELEVKPPEFDTSKITKILDKIKKPVLQPYIMLTHGEIETVKRILETNISAFRFESDIMFVEAMRLMKNLLDRLP